MMKTRITFDNFTEYLNKPVEVEILCYSGGMNSPDNNILIGMNEGNYYFYAHDEGEEAYFWHYSVNDADCSVEVFAVEEGGRDA